MFIKSLFVLMCAICIQANCSAQKKKDDRIICGDERISEYLPMLKGKKVAFLVNNTAVIGHTFLVDTLKKLGVIIKVIFGPEHGFRGVAPDGAKIDNSIDPTTGAPVISLYGKKNKPTSEDLKDVDFMVYDVQDVGTRFYTFISSMQYFMEAALENNIPFLILDRPNPNGFYVDGPVLEPKFKSFVGLQPVPVVYGMTIGEYAQMILMQGWLSPEANNAYNKLKSIRFAPGAKYFQLNIIPCANYTHKSKYIPPIPPSPNLPSIQSIYWYASHCFFEGTVITEGRGTDMPFAIIGHPSFPKTMFKFTPHGNAGAPNPKYKDQVCYGWNLKGTPEEVLKMIDARIQLKYFLEAYRLFSEKDSFFHKNNGINRLAGTDEFMQQVKAGKTEDEIRKSWQPKLEEFKKIRKNYLLYADFE